MKKNTEHTVVDAPFEARALLRSSGAKWLDGPGVWVFEGAPPDWAQVWAAKDYSWEKAVENSLNGTTHGHDKGEEGFSLRDHQKDGVKIIDQARKAGLPGFLLADEVGLGKTHTAWQSVLNLIQEKKGKADILIVCPLSVVPHWRKALRKQGDGGARIIVMNYDRMQKLFVQDNGKAKSRKGVARKGEPPSFDVVIFDEAHKMKNITAARSKLGAKIASRADFCIWMSATAGQTPLELSYAAPLLAARTGTRLTALTKDFEDWCKTSGLGVTRGKFGKWEWDGTRESMEKTRDMLFGSGKGQTTGALRRKPEDVAGWPPIQRIVMPTELSREEAEAYMKAWEDFKRDWNTHGDAFLTKARTAGKASSKATAALVAMLRFRQKASIIRIKQTMDFARDLLEQGMQVAISCAFKDAVEAFYKEFDEEFGCAMITGAVSGDEREKERLSFQRGEKRVVAFTVEEGISLHEGEEKGGERRRALIIHDLRWSAIQMAQIEGRCHRDGKSAPAYWMMAEGTIEEELGRRLAGRMSSTKALSGDEVDDAEFLGRELLKMMGG